MKDTALESSSFDAPVFFADIIDADGGVSIPFIG